MLSLNCTKTCCMQFRTKKTANKLNIEYGNKLLLESHYVKFLGITLDNTIFWTH
jgi:hypothetical protein